MTPVGAPVAYEAQAQQLSTIDTKNGVFYFVGLNLTTNVDAIVGLSLETGAVVSEIPVPIVSGVRGFRANSPHASSVVIPMFLRRCWLEWDKCLITTRPRTN